MRNYLKFFLLISVWLITEGLAAQLDNQISKLLSNSDLKGSEIGISIIDLEGKDIYSLNSDQALIAASLVKLITNFSILDELGPSYYFETKVGFRGDILPDGNLLGDIIIFGNGDPSLASERFQKRPQLNELLESIFQAIRKAGISCIDGNIICDASYFGEDGTIHSWSYEDIGNYYGANTWSINIHENYYNLYFELSDSSNKKPLIQHLSPSIPELYFENLLETGKPGSGDQAYIFGMPYSNKRIIRGTLPQGKGKFRIKGSLPNAPEFFARELSGKLHRENIDHTGYQVEYNAKQNPDHWIYTVKSPSLSALVKTANLESVNLYCESFTRAMGKGDLNLGLSKMKLFLAKNNIDTSFITIEDGSGLSFWNHINAEVFSSLILSLYNQYGQQLKDYFPEAGNTGTLYYLFRNSPAKGNLWAKSGSMRQVVNYAGFTVSKKAEPLFFCIMINRHKVSNRKVRNIVEKIMEMIYLYD